MLRKIIMIINCHFQLLSGVWCVSQADGSAMYSLQALWTQAREGLKVITIICANQSYAILKVIN